MLFRLFISTNATGLMPSEARTSKLCHQNTIAEKSLLRLLLMLLLLLIQCNINLMQYFMPYHFKSQFRCSYLNPPEVETILYK